jgi:SnoaL-like domain
VRARSREVGVRDKDGSRPGPDSIRQVDGAGRRAPNSPPPPCWVGPVKLTRARRFIEAVTAHDFEAAERLLDPDVETVTPRGTLRGIEACRQVLQKASGDEQFAMEQAEPEF